MFKREPIIPTRYEDIADPLLQDDLRGLAGKLKREVVDNPIRLKMPIGEFTQKWLNMFICRLDPKDHPAGIPVVRWINEVTLNPYTWVDIVEPNGNVAYSVPPMLNSDAVKIDHVDFYHHLMEMQAMTDHGSMPGEVEKYRQENVLNFIKGNPNAETWINEINKMAMYHGFAPFTAPAETTETNLQNPVEDGIGAKVRKDEF